MNIKKLLPLVFVIAILSSCQKDDNTPVKKSKSIEANYLSFKDRNAFETAINSKDLKSLRTVN